MRRDPLRDAIEKLKQDFPGKSRSWIKRAIMRLGDVRELKFGLYLVEGRRELCDWKPLYQVWYSERGAVGTALVTFRRLASQGSGTSAPTWQR